MKSIIRILFLVAMTSDAFAGTKLPSEYRLDILTEADNQNAHETYYVSGGNVRHERGSNADVAVDVSNVKENITYRLFVGAKLYEELPYQPVTIEFEDREMQLTFERAKAKQTQLKLTGTETINGQACDVYRETSSQVPNAEFIFWVSKAYGIPIRIISRFEDPATKKMKQIKKEWIFKPGPQSAELFVVPAGYKRNEVVVLASVEGAMISSYDLIARPKAVHRALCGDQKFYQIRYSERHIANLNCNEPSCQDDFNSDRYEFVGDQAPSGMCLIGDDDYFRGKTILRLSDNSEGDHPQCGKEVIQALEKIKGIPIKGCWSLGKFGKDGSYNIEEFVERDSTRAAGLSLHEGKRIVLEDWTKKVPAEWAPDVWRLNDGGEFHPEENAVLFGLRSGDEFDLVTKGMGGEGINYYLKRTVGDEFYEITHTYIYTMGH